LQPVEKNIDLSDTMDTKAGETRYMKERIVKRQEFRAWKGI
jgi:hypothetical protein